MLKAMTAYLASRAVLVGKPVICVRELARVYARFAQKGITTKMVIA